MIGVIVDSGERNGIDSGTWEIEIKFFGWDERAIRFRSDVVRDMAVGYQYQGIYGFHHSAFRIGVGGGIASLDTNLSAMNW